MQTIMHWLDSTPSREIDPVLDCLAFLARQADRPSSPVLLRAGLALSDTGTLPFHQIEPALDQVGMRGEPLVRRLKGWPLQKLPAILELEDDRAAVLLETKGGDGLLYAPGIAEPSWVDLREIEPAFTGRAVYVEADPTRERASERPWDEARRKHWFWSEAWKVRREFWPVMLAALVVNLLALAMPLFTMNVYDRVIPNKAIPTLWVLAFGVMEVVPMGEKLLVETRVKPSDIAFIKVGDKALVKVTAYDFSTYGGLEGKVVQVSADSIFDEVEKQPYFTVIVETQKSYLASGAHRLPITPGMKSGVFETKLTIRNVIDQLNEQLKQKPEESQFYSPLKAFPDSISAADKERLTAETRAVIADQIYPAMPASGSSTPSESRARHRGARRSPGPRKRRTSCSTRR